MVQNKGVIRAQTPDASNTPGNKTQEMSLPPNVNKSLANY